MLYSFGVVFLLAVAAVGLLLTFPPTGLVENRIIAAVEQQTGRKLEIGSAGLSLFSGLGVTLSNVSLSAPRGMTSAPLITARNLDVEIAILPFIMREIKVERLVLKQPVLNLVVDERGQRNWDFAGAQQPQGRVRYAQLGNGKDAKGGNLPPVLKDFVENGSQPQAAAVKDPAIGLSGLILADVRVVDGHVIYADKRSGVSRDVKGINARLSLPHLGGRLKTSGDFLLEGERVAMEGQLDAMSELLANQPAKVSLRLDGQRVGGQYTGNVTLGKEPSLDGHMVVQAPDVAKLADMLQLPVSGLDGLGRLKIGGTIRGSQAALMLSSAELRLGQAQAHGMIEARLSGKRPDVRFDLTVAGLNIDTLQSAARDIQADHAAGRFAAPGSADGKVGGASSITDLLRQSAMPPGQKPAGPQVRGFRQTAGNAWDIEPLDTAILTRADVNGRLVIADGSWRGIQARNVQVSTTLKDAHLRATLSEGEIAGGKVRVLASVDGRGKELVCGLNVSSDGVELAPLLRAAGVDVLEGRGRAVVTLSAKGASERDLVSTLGGHADIHARDGALVGWNADAMLAGLRRGEMPSTQRISDAKTPFKSFSGTFSIAQGVARTKDLQLASQTLDAKGTGVINIVDRNLDMKFVPHLSGGGLEIPVRVAGPWDKPSLMPDVAGALNSDTGRDAVHHLRDGNVDGALLSVLGDGPKADRKRRAAKDFLNDLFGK
ncbi:MAG: AsmA family protein [Hyphomicrobiaceae bacterium]